ncbi:MAG: DEAD/DEAH box helicase family protein [Eubacteriales bacterium]
MTNFDHFTKEPQFQTFAKVAVNAEKCFAIDPATAAVNCRRAMEFAIKWLYSVENALYFPENSTLHSLLTARCFKQFIDPELFFRLDFIRKAGNDTSHEKAEISEQKATICLQNLYIFLDFLGYCYGEHYEDREFDPVLLKQGEAVPASPISEVDFTTLQKEKEDVREELSQRCEEKKESYEPKPLDLSEYATRKIYIDTMLRDLGWKQKGNWIDEVELQGMPNKSEVGFADYVLYDDVGKPLAVIEAKRTSVSVEKGRIQGTLYAELLEKQHGVKPVLFLTNGFEYRLLDWQYPERKVAGIYAKRDLEKLYNLRKQRTPLKNIEMNKKIADRYYQEGAIRAVCRTLEENQRKALLVMATGSGKTRTVIALCEILQKHGWVKNILFLADRTPLISQAKRSFVNLLPNLSCTNLCEDKKNTSAHCVFSTYQTMINCIDTIKDKDGKLFTTGHFDLVICDEAHRSIYNKYKDIFTYFDAPLVGLTATPKDEIDKNTYEIFQLDKGIPTYGYELAQAVRDGYLVDFMSVESKLKFIDEGIHYDDLSDEEKEEFEETFTDDAGNVPKKILSSALNEWLFNEDTISKVLDLVMTQGISVDYGSKLGKTIVFAKNHLHAEKIYEIFNKNYPHLPGFAQVIDNYINYAETAIDSFTDGNKMPHIAISVDMLDTGIDIPEVVNLVFFKRVMSKAKFWQMIGRGTRLCPNLIDGTDKSKFYIFDCCGNFKFFRMHEGKTSNNILPLQGALVNLKAKLVLLLQDFDYQSPELQEIRENLVIEVVGKVSELNKEHFAVQQHLEFVEKFSDKKAYDSLTSQDTALISEHLAHLILPDKDEISALRFDALLYGIEFAFLAKKPMSKGIGDLFQRVNDISRIQNVPEITAQHELIEKILHNDYMGEATIPEFEHIRKSLRGLVKFIKKEHRIYSTNFTDEITTEWHESDLENDDLKNYKEKAEFYVREHQNHPTIAKLKHNEPLTFEDMVDLQDILWSQVGTAEEYENTFGEKPLGEFVREILGLDMNAAKKAFGVFLSNANLDDRQIYFVNQIVEYIVENGMMKDLSVLQEAPFTSKGSVVEIFTDLSVWQGIHKIIQEINQNVKV